MPHADAVYRAARLLCGNDRDAEDLAQEALLRAYRFFHSYQPGTNCRGWLMRILHNVYINDWNRRKRSPTPVSVDDVEEFFLYAHMRVDAPGTPGPEDQVMAGAWDHEIVAAFDRLPEEFRTAVLLCDVEELSYKDIAETLHVPIGTVRSRLARGRGMLRKLLYDYARERGAVESGADSSSEGRDRGNSSTCVDG